ncbi:uncharacterized protein PGTG_03676 [Puccinia graminis f. sp. tritici CRL 75-36-700-3]|uniref:Uncharacterized protein n=1 Tax=Puccinia graminis f. sp. tritici (strain CRL 75-36-700-3 / race SCCL) TaxID=418459 RepID=E3K095_PUCGT|nr:uncharacterized protein PGTG_03676 [Puccinia graminis f. sp. tritici CRL 75-36-700-3]EFP77720.1 hypothetical protein PGTG_03676 [Puccinia graminis f. sp. tritici CRL 75-36-700-3]
MKLSLHLLFVACYVVVFAASLPVPTRHSGVKASLKSFGRPYRTHQMYTSMMKIKPNGTKLSKIGKFRSHSASNNHKKKTHVIKASGKGPKRSRATKPAKGSAKGAKASKGAKTTKASKTAKGTKNVKASKGVKPGKAPKTAKNSKNVKAFKIGKASKTKKGSKSAKSANSAKKVLATKIKHWNSRKDSIFQSIHFKGPYKSLGRKPVPKVITPKIAAMRRRLAIRHFARLAKRGPLDSPLATLFGTASSTAGSLPVVGIPLTSLLSSLPTNSLASPGAVTGLLSTLTSVGQNAPFAELLKMSPISSILRGNPLDNVKSSLSGLFIGIPVLGGPLTGLFGAVTGAASSLSI